MRPLRRALRAPATTKVLVAASAPQGQLWLLDSAQPWLAALDEYDPTEPSRASVWDFSRHRHSVPPQGDGGGTPEPLSVYPALDPLGASGQAVAIVSSSRQMYSGGGAAFDVADFVELVATPAAAASTVRVVYAGVPFSCTKSIRACFTEKEYRGSPHCSDDSDGHLTIAFDGSGAPPGCWFRWHEKNWPGGAPQSRPRSTQSGFKLPPGPRAVAGDAPARSASFCGGPAS